MGYQADNKVTERGTERYGEVRRGKGREGLFT